MRVVVVLCLVLSVAYGNVQDEWEELQTPGSNEYVSLHSPLVAVEQPQNGQTRMTLDLPKYNRILNAINAGSKHIKLVETGLEGGAELDVSPFEVFTKDAVIETDDPNVKYDIPEMIYLRGKVAGDDKSFATVHIGKHGAYGMVQSKGRTWQFGAPKDRSVHSVLMEITKESENKVAMEEAVDEELSAPIMLPKDVTTLAQTKAVATADSFDGTSTNPVLTLALEIDRVGRDLFQDSGQCMSEIPSILVDRDPRPQDDSEFQELMENGPFSSDQSSTCSAWVAAGYSCTNTQITVNGANVYTLSQYCCQSCGSCGPSPAPTPSPTWAAGDGVAGCTHPAATYLSNVIAGTSSIYSRDVGVALQIQYMKVWGGASPYDQGTNSLNAFRASYSGATGTRAASIAHLFTGLVQGGLAYVGTACNTQGYNTGVSSIRGTWTGSTSASAYNWDLIVTAHEMGHNVGSGHTHDQSSYNPRIDQCVSSSGQAVSRGSSQCVTGTIMSYCHLCGGTANINMGFADRVKAQIRSTLSGGSCQLSLS